MAEKTLQRIIIYGLVAISIAPFFGLCFFAKPYSDDFTFAGRVEARGAAGFILWEYLNWLGCYVSLAAVAFLNTLNYHWIGGMGFYFAMIMLLFPGTLFLLLKPISITYSSGPEILLGSCAITALLFSTMPEPFSSLYWLYS